MWELVETGEGAFGFDSRGWRMLQVDDPEKPPGEWSPRVADRGELVHELLPGSFGLVQRGRYIYAFSADDEDHNVYTARWTVDAFTAGALSRAKWWYGEKRGWQSLDPEEVPAALFGDAQSEGSIHFDEESGSWIAVYSVGFGLTALGVRTARAPTGPWSDVERLHRPLKSGHENHLVYAGKAHPWAPGDGILATYVVNHSDFGRLVSDESLYYPRTVRLHLDEGR